MNFTYNYNNYDLHMLSAHFYASISLLQDKKVLLFFLNKVY